MPYRESFVFDAFSNLTGRSSDSWNFNDSLSDDATFANNRRSDWGYDADGRTTTIGTRNYSFDADGQVRSMVGRKFVANHYIPTNQALSYDGDGDRVKETLDGITTYYLKSSVLDALTVEDLTAPGRKELAMCAIPRVSCSRDKQTTRSPWEQMTPVGTTKLETNSGNSNFTRTEFDAMGANIPLFAPPVNDTGGGMGDIGGSHSGGMMDSRFANFFDLSAGCQSTEVSAQCHGVMSPDQYLDAQTRSFFGDRYYDLPGNDNEIERGERIYVKMVEKTISEYRKAQKAKKKPKSPPTLHKKHERRLRSVERARRPRRAIGPDKEGPDAASVQPGGALEIDVATGQVIAVLTPNETETYNRQRKDYYACLGREEKTFKENVKKIEETARESYEKNGMPKWLQILVNLPSAIPGGDSKPEEKLLEAMPEILSYNEMIQEIDRRTKQETKRLDDAIKNNCKEPTLPK